MSEFFQFVRESKEILMENVKMIKGFFTSLNLTQNKIVLPLCLFKDFKAITNGLKIKVKTFPFITDGQMFSNLKIQGLMNLIILRLHFDMLSSHEKNSKFTLEGYKK